MARSSWKPPYFESALLALAQQNELLRRETARTRSRKTYIVPKLIGKLLEIHNGKQFIRLRITEDMVSHKLGEFSPTRKACVHKCYN
ncbi:MAG: 30S ribosomal protein S19 [Candidatus Hodgkinia cicadicola]|nr:MAG: 30S ribosomal protein S19 [Candidatus Hodgkinia cicadicola]